jgi:hypothetical protein
VRTGGNGLLQSPISLRLFGWLSAFSMLSALAADLLILRPTITFLVSGLTAGGLFRRQRNEELHSKYRRRSNDWLIDDRQRRQSCRNLSDDLGVRL